MEVAAAVVAFLAPYLAEAGKSFAGKAGDAAFEGAKSLVAAIRRKFAGDDDKVAQQTLDRVIEEPGDENWTQMLTLVLQTKAAADPAFAQELVELLEGAGGPKIKLDLRMRNVKAAGHVSGQDVRVAQGVNADIDSRASVEDVEAGSFTGIRLDVGFTSGEDETES